MFPNCLFLKTTEYSCCSVKQGLITMLLLRAWMNLPYGIYGGRTERFAFHSFLTKTQIPSEITQDTPVRPVFIRAGVKLCYINSSNHKA